MLKLRLPIAIALAACFAAGAARADLTLGVSLPLTGPASGLGIPMKNYFALWPQTVAGEKINLIILDDATDPTNGARNAKRFVTEDKVDVIMGSAATPVAIAMADIAAEAKTVQLMFSPAQLPPGKDHWSFRLPQSNSVMSHAMIEHMKKQGVKTVGFLGYTDAYGESWLTDFKAQSQQLGGPQVVAVERFARADTSVTGQALKLVAANPDAMLIVASGSGAAMPHKGVVERGYKGKIYQTHGVGNPDFLRVVGKDGNGTLLPIGPMLVYEQLPDSNPLKKTAAEYITKYEAKHGKDSRSTFGGHAWDAYLLLARAIPEALKKAKPGTKEFRAALRDALENTKELVATHGVYTMTPQDHNGLDNRARTMIRIDNGKWVPAK